MRRLPTLLLLTLVLLAAGCQQAYQDLEGLEVVDPDRAIIVRNADQFPNLSVLCFEDTAIITTTREAAPVIDQGSIFCVDEGTQ
ncbi:hypothetical protein [Euzebya sp.]|uniref:hypothetical protein n=1 Tax=Euzebya sp. TaxID=1971409 RepID=UPI0035141FE6